MRYGDRELDFLPLADHGLEIYNPDGYAAAVRWMGGTPSPTFPFRILGLAAALLGGLGLTLALGLPALEHVRSRRAPIIAGLALVIPLGLVYRAWPDAGWHTAMLVIFAAACILDAMLPGERMQRFGPSLRRVGLYAALLWLLFVIAFLIHRGTAIRSVKALGYFLWGPFLYVGVTAQKVTHFQLEAQLTHHFEGPNVTKPSNQKCRRGLKIRYGDIASVAQIVMLIEPR